MSLLKTLLKKFSEKEQPIYIVSGLPRSGTSMMMKMLAAGGMELLVDNIREADENNPRGYYEFEMVKQLKSGDITWLPEAQGKVVKIISALVEFLPGNYHYNIVFMRREMVEILASQRQMLIRDGKVDDKISDEKMANLYNAHLKNIETWLAKQPNIHTLYIDYNEMLKDPLSNIKTINEFLGGELNTQEMLLVVDKNLYRERHTN